MATKKAVPEYFQADLKIYFQAEHIACQYCPALETYARKQCRMTGCYIVDDSVVHFRCPFYEKAIDFQTIFNLKKYKGEKND